MEIAEVATTLQQIFKKKKKKKKKKIKDLSSES